MAHGKTLRHAPSADDRTIGSKWMVSTVETRELTRWTQPPDAENRMSGGVGGLTGAIPLARPDLTPLNTVSFPMQLQDLISKTCVIGLSYFDQKGELLKQTQYAGRVTQVDNDKGISIQLQHSDPTAEQPIFILPPNLNAWFKAPAGHYRHPESGVDIENPDLLTTWCIYKTKDDTAESQHEWWEWVPNTEPPQVGQKQ